MPQPLSVSGAPNALIAAYQKAWDRILAEQRALLMDPLAFRRRRRLQELQVAIEDALAGLDTKTRAWVDGELPKVQQVGLATGAVQATGLTNVPLPAIHDRRAAQIAAERLYDDLLSATDGVRESTKQLIREVAKDQTFNSIAAGDTAQQAGRAMEDILARKGVYSVKYADGSVHGLDSYSAMTLRTSTGLAYNQATIDGALGYGVEWFEVLDGPSCQWVTHSSGGLALGKIVTADEAARHPLSHPNCVLPWVRFASYGHVVEMVRAWYSGDVYTLCCEAYETTVGPNHPVLTGRGWLPAHLLREGDELVHDRRHHRDHTFAGEDVADLKHVPTIADVFVAMGEPASSDLDPQDLHGDAVFCKGEIQVVSTAGELRLVGDPGRVEEGGEFYLVGSGERVVFVPRLNGCSVPGLRMSGASLGTAERRETGGLLLGSQPGIVSADSLATRPDDASPMHDATDDQLGAPKLRCDLVGAHTGQVEAGSFIPVDTSLGRRRAGPRAVPSHVRVAVGAEDLSASLAGARENGSHGTHLSRLTATRVTHYEGWVYDCTTEQGAFNVDGFVVKNCRRSFAARPDVTSADEAKTAPRSTTPEQAQAQIAQDEERAQALLSRQARRQAVIRSTRAPTADRHAARLQARSQRLAARRARQ
jgi:hypothetical protein